MVVIAIQRRKQRQVPDVAGVDSTCESHASDAEHEPLAAAQEDFEAPAIGKERAMLSGAV